MTQTHEFTADESAAGERIDRWLAGLLAPVTRNRVKAMIEGGALLRDGAPHTDPSYRLRGGETVTLTPPPVEDAEPKAQDIPLNVLFEDEYLIVLDKPAGMVVHPAAGNWSGTLVNALLHHCAGSLSGIGGVARPGIVHRLDKETSGVMVVAKSDEAHQGLTTLWQAHDVERAYLAICHGSPRPAVGTIELPLARAGGDKRKQAVTDWENPAGREAITHFKRLEAYGTGRAKLPGDSVASLIECRLETGRTHQIRVHMSHVGHPLVGDPVYGRTGLAGLRPEDEAAERALGVVSKFRRQALHAAILGFAHPITGEDLRFETEPPKDFAKLRAALAAL
ncbi:RluA family pseudouridine synthase [Parvularcula oceani]|uniref:RluA family pseudouridine synthase n=1 Tax=Parvularcula oceani TaxID=1247963 RepID=UPI0004E12782|nr:RluA family pseudouridine synthase [Parvularcula oceani]